MKRIILLLMTVLTCLLANPLTAGAFSFFGGAHCENANNAQSAVCTSQTTQNPVPKTLNKITDIVAFVAGAAAIIVLIVSGIRYITSGGDPGKVKSARETAVGAVVGLIIIALSATLISYVINKL